MPPGALAPANLPELVRAAFAEARANGHLHYFATQVAVVPVGRIPFQVRFAPALADKPKAAAPAPAHPPADPFASPPRALLVCDVGPAHRLVLNKFAVVPEHSILATRAWADQTHLLDEADLAATLACLRAYDAADAARPLFAFFNSGAHSGASQPHRHLQLLPVARMRDGLPGRQPGQHMHWDVLADSADLLQETPFAAFSEAISLDTSPADLHATYLRLYRRACRAVDAHKGGGGGGGGDAAPSPPSQGPASISYNLAMTRSRLVVCPRLAEGDALMDRQTGDPVGRPALNGTVLAGTALVKTEAEWDALRGEEGVAALERVLARIGVPRETADGTRL